MRRRSRELKWDDFNSSSSFVVHRAREDEDGESKRVRFRSRETDSADVVAGCKKRTGNERTQQRESARKRSARAVVKIVI